MVIKCSKRTITVIENKKIVGKTFNEGFTVFRFCNLKDCIVTCGKLEGCTFIGGKAEGCEFVLCTKIKKAELKDCLFDYCSLTDCKVTKAGISNSILGSSSFNYVQIDAATELTASIVSLSVLDRLPVAGDIADGYADINDTCAESLDDAECGGGALCI